VEVQALEDAEQASSEEACEQADVLVASVGTCMAYLDVVQSRDAYRNKL
jgi:hypothetical protein